MSPVYSRAAPMSCVNQPRPWYTNNDIARCEGFYASVFYSYFAGLGLDIEQA